MAGEAHSFVRVVVLAFALALIACVPASAAELTAPEDGATVSPTPTFEWRLAPGERTYDVDLSRDSSYFSPGGVYPPNDAQRYTPEQPLEPGTWYWRLRYYPANGGGLRESAPRRFTVPTPPLDKLGVDAYPVNDRDEESDEFLTEDLFPERYIDNATQFDVTLTPYTSAVLMVTYRGKRVYTSDLREVGDQYAEGPAADELSDTYPWTCKRQGKHTWTVAAFDSQGGSKQRTGTFSVGRCGTEKAPVTRRTMIKYIEDDFRSEDFVSYVKCAPAAKLKKGASTAWRCAIVWNDLRRACGARYLFTHTENLRFGQAIGERYRARRETKFFCEQFAR